MSKNIRSLIRVLPPIMVVGTMLSGWLGLGFQAIGVVILMTAYRQELADSFRRLMADEPPAGPVMTEQGKSVVAFHEAGHAVVGWVLPGPGKPHSATIKSSGETNGRVVNTHRSSDSWTLEIAINQLAFWYAGWAAEKEFGLVQSMGWKGDLAYATNLARRMVCEWGFSGKLPRRHYDVESGLLTEEILTIINAEIDRFLQEGERRAIKAAKEHHDAIGRVAGLLLQHETLDAKQLREAIGFDPAH